MARLGLLHFLARCCCECFESWSQSQPWPSFC